MPGLYVRDTGGVARKYRELHETQGGMDRKIREMYTGDTQGVSRRVFSGAITWYRLYDASGSYSIDPYNGSDYFAFKLTKVKQSGDYYFSVGYSFSETIYLKDASSEPSITFNVIGDNGTGDVDIDGVNKGSIGDNGTNIYNVWRLGNLRIHESGTNQHEGSAWHMSLEIVLHTVKWGDIRLLGSSGTLENS